MEYGDGGAINAGQDDGVVLRIGADASPVWQALADIERRSTELEQRLSQGLGRRLTYGIEIKVDDSRLYALNRHLDVKEAHVDRLQRKWNANPLKIRFDASELDKGLAEVNRKLAQSTKAKVTVEATIQTDLIKSQIQTLDKTLQQLQGGIQIKGIDDLPDRIAKAIEKSQQPSLLSRVGSVATAPFRLTGGLIAGALSGIGFGITGNATALAGKGIESAINNAIGKRFGSIDLIIEKAVTRYGTQAVKLVTGIDIPGFDNAIQQKINNLRLPEKTRREIQDFYKEIRQTLIGTAEIVDREISTLVPQDEAKIKGLANKRKQSRQDEQNLILARQQSQLDVRDAGRQYFDARNFIDERIPQLKNQAIELNTQIKSIAKNIQDLGREFERSLNPDFIGAIKPPDIAGKELDDQVKRLELLQTQYQQTIKLINQAPSQLKQAAATFEAQTGIRNQLAPQQLPQVIQVALAKLTKDKLPADRDIPKFQIQESYLQSIGFGGDPAPAAYNPDANLILLSKELRDKLTDVNKMSASEVQQIAEELAHAIQTGFGSFEGAIAATRGLPINKTTVTPADRMALEPTLQIYRDAGYEKTIPLELDAKTRVRQVFPDLMKDVLPSELFQSVDRLNEFYERLAKRTEAIRKTLEYYKQLGGDSGRIDKALSYVDAINLQQRISQAKNTTEISGVSGVAFSAQQIPERFAEVGKIVETLQNLESRIGNLKPVTDIVPVSATETIEKSSQSMASRVQEFGLSIIKTSDQWIAPAGKMFWQATKTFSKAAIDAALYTATHPGYVLRRGIQDTAMAAGAMAIAPHLPYVGGIAGGIGHLVNGVASPLLSSALGGGSAQLTASILANPFVHALGKIPFAGSEITGAIVGGVTGLTSALTGSAGAIAGGSAILGAATAPLRMASKALGTPMPQMQLPFAQKQPEYAALPGTPPPSSLKNAATVETRLGQASVMAKANAVKVIAATNSEITKLVDLATDAWSDLDKEAIASEALSQAKKIQANFQSAYQRFQKAVKSGDTQLAEALGSTILETVKNAEAEIKTSIEGLSSKGVDVGAGSPIRAKLSGILQTFTKSSQGVERGYSKLERDRKTGQVTLDVNSTTLPAFGIGTAARFAGQRGFSGVSTRLDEINRQIETEGVFNTAISSPAIRDLAVNTAGFAASQVGMQHGQIAGMAGDLTGALVARKALTDMITLYKAYRQSVKETGDQSQESASKIERWKTILGRTAEIARHPEFQKEFGKELFGDVTGFGVGNATALGLQAMGINIPLQGAAGAMAAVPQLQKLRDRIVPEISTTTLPSLKPGQVAKRLSDATLNLLSELGELVETAYGLSGNIRKNIRTIKRDVSLPIGIPLPTPDSDRPRDGVYFNPSRRLQVGGLPLVGVSTDADRRVQEINQQARRIENNADRADFALRQIEQSVNQQVKRAAETIAEQERIVQAREEQARIERELAEKNRPQQAIDKARAARLAASEAMNLVDDQITALDTGLPRQTPDPGKGQKLGFFEDVKRGADALKERFPVLQRTQNFVRDIAGSIVLGLGVFTVGDALVRLGRSGFDAYLNLDRLRIALNFTEAGNGARALEQVRKQADAAGISFLAAAESRKQFSLAAQGTSLELVAPTLSGRLQTAIAPFGLSGEQQKSVGLAASQIVSKGRFMGEEGLQLAEAGLPAQVILSQALGVSGQQLAKMQQSGQISAEKALPLFINQLQARSGSAADEFSKSPNAAINRIGNESQRSLLLAGEAAGSVALPAIQGLTKGLKFLNDNAEIATTGVTTLATAFALSLGAQAAGAIRGAVLGRVLTSAVALQAASTAGFGAAGIFAAGGIGAAGGGGLLKAIGGTALGTAGSVATAVAPYVAIAGAITLAGKAYLDYQDKVVKGADVLIEANKGILKSIEDINKAYGRTAAPKQNTPSPEQPKSSSGVLGFLDAVYNFGRRLPTASDIPGILGGVKNIIQSPNPIGEGIGLIRKRLAPRVDDNPAGQGEFETNVNNFNSVLTNARNAGVVIRRELGSPETATDLKVRRNFQERIDALSVERAIASRNNDPVQFASIDRRIGQLIKEQQDKAPKTEVLQSKLADNKAKLQSGIEFNKGFLEQNPNLENSKKQILLSQIKDAEGQIRDIDNALESLNKQVRVLPQNLGNKFTGINASLEALDDAFSRSQRRNNVELGTLQGNLENRGFAITDVNYVVAQRRFEVDTKRLKIQAKELKDRQKEFAAIANSLRDSERESLDKVIGQVSPGETLATASAATLKAVPDLVEGLNEDQKAAIQSALKVKEISSRYLDLKDQFNQLNATKRQLERDKKVELVERLKVQEDINRLEQQRLRSVQATELDILNQQLDADRRVIEARSQLAQGQKEITTRLGDFNVEQIGQDKAFFELRAGNIAAQNQFNRSQVIGQISDPFANQKEQLGIELGGLNFDQQATNAKQANLDKEIAAQTTLNKLQDQALANRRQALTTTQQAAENDLQTQRLQAEGALSDADTKLKQAIARQDTPQDIEKLRKQVELADQNLKNVDSRLRALRGVNAAQQAELNLSQQLTKTEQTRAQLEQQRQQRAIADEQRRNDELRRRKQEELENLNKPRVRVGLDGNPTLLDQNQGSLKRDIQSQIDAAIAPNLKSSLGAFGVPEQQLKVDTGLISRLTSVAQFNQNNPFLSSSLQQFGVQDIVSQLSKVDQFQRQAVLSQADKISQRFDQDVLSVLRQILAKVGTPRSLSVTSTNPIGDAASILSDLARL